MEYKENTGFSGNEFHRGEVIEDSSLAVFVEEDEIITLTNSAFSEMVGAVSVDDILGKSPLLFFPEHNHKLLQSQINQLRAGKTDVVFLETTIQRLNGKMLEVEILASAFRSATGKVAIHAVIRDLTEYKKMQCNLMASEEKFSKAFRTSPDAININRLSDGMYIDINNGFTEMTGYTPEDVKGKTSLEISIWNNPLDRQNLVDVLSIEGKVSNFESEFRCKDGSIITALMSAEIVDINSEKCLLSITRDISESKKAALALAKSEERLRLAIQSAPIPMMVHTDDGVVSQLNDEWTRISGYTAADIPTIDAWVKKAYPEVAESIKFDMDSLYSFSGSKDEGEYTITTKDGKKRIWYFRSASLEQSFSSHRAVITTAIDVTEQRQAEKERDDNSQRIITLLKLNQMTNASTHDITDFALEAAVSITDSELGYLAFLNEGETVLTMYSWSKNAMEKCAMQSKPIKYDLEKTGLWGEAVRQRQPIITNDYEAPNPLKRGYPAGHVKLNRHLCVPIFDGEKIVAVAGVGNKGTDYGMDDVRQLTLLISGMWRLLERKRSIDEIIRQKERLDRTLNSVIDITSDIVEIRDPYTAGHQRRVTDLAVAIATKMGLPNVEIETIRTSALMHDLGKMNIPSEILTKPGKITNTEFQLLKEHAESGYRIISSAHMDDEIAETVRQHHERCDGSGYPRGLKADEILLSAKVIAVADVVEAMTSHRPYRPALGVDAALEEIEAGTGTRYDAEVASICIELFRKNEFSFSE